MTVTRETVDLRERLADRMDAHPPEDWSPALLRALIAVFDMYEADQLQERPASVLEFVRP